MGANATPIPVGKYYATTTSVLSGHPLDLASDQLIGEIKRNGASVEIAHLTRADKYNQRIVIVNRSGNAVTYEIGQFAEEAGRMATPGPMATGEIAADSTLVLLSRDVVELSQGERTSAVISLNADSSDVQVATTTVNREDGATDTVLYTTLGGG